MATASVEIAASDYVKLQNMLGAGVGSKKKDWGFRNYYAAPLSGQSTDAMRRLEAAGLVTQGRVSGDLIYFHATEAGCKALSFTAAQVKRAFED